SIRPVVQARWRFEAILRLCTNLAFESGWTATSGLTRGAIRRWRVGVGDDRETEFRFDYEVLAVTDEIGVARWIASADMPSDGKRLLFDGVFAVVLRGELCSEFREWWNTNEVPLS